MPRREFPRKIRQAAIERAAGRCEPRAKSKNFKWLESLVRAGWPAECIEWPYAKRPSGYGTIFWRGIRTTSHRVVCELAYGPAPEQAMHAAHSCGNRGCVNPMHLSWKTPADNIADKIGHGTDKRGSLIPWAKLTESDVSEIKRRLEEGKRARAVAKEFGVHFGTISDIATGKTWRHVA